jgi:hypothetical protein
VARAWARNITDFFTAATQGLAARGALWPDLRLRLLAWSKWAWGEGKMRRVVFKARFLWFVAFAMVAGAWPIAAQAAIPTIPPLGTAANFAVIAGIALTCTDSSVTGQVGVNFGTPVTATRCTMQAAQFDPAGKQAFSDFRSAYDKIATNIANNPSSCDRTFGIADTLDKVSLGPGTYCFASYAKLTGTLTLTGGGPWLFEIGTGTGYLEATNFTVVSDNPCNAFWWVRDYATLTTSAFQGTILGGSAITTTGTSLVGNAWATVALTMTGSQILGCGSIPSGTTPQCLAAQQALDVAKAQDVIEDASERARDKKEAKDKDGEDKADRDSERDSHESKNAEKKENRAEERLMRSLEQAVRDACNPEHDD